MRIKLSQPMLGYGTGDVITVSGARGQYWVANGVGVEVDEKNRPVDVKVFSTGEAETASIEPVENALIEKPKPKMYGRKK